MNPGVADGVVLPAVSVVLAVPLGLDRQIYPWGVQSIADYLRSTDTSAAVSIFDMRSIASLRAVLDKHRATMGQAFEHMHMDAAAVFFGHTLNPYLLLGVLGATGRRFIEIGRANGLFSLFGVGVGKKLAHALDKLQTDYEALLVEVLAENVQSQSDHRVLAVSVYDYTLFNSLHLARLAKAHFPGITVIFGGDYFDTESARTLMETTKEVDAIVVGYGEEVMREIIHCIAGGGRLHHMRISSLVLSPAAMSHQQNDTEITPVVPPSYGTDKTPIDYVLVQGDAQVRILTQRGCSWGECTFCSQIDRRMYFANSEDVMLDLASKVAKAWRGSTPAGPPPTRRILFDADENNLQTLIRLINCFKSSDPGSPRYLADFWLMVRSFEPQLVTSLLHDNANLKVKARINLETLNIKTLRAMHKGATPLQGVSALKALLDGGQFVETNYFTEYPGEDIESIRQEVSILSRVVHLFMAPMTGFWSFPYAANGRDDIARQAKELKIAISDVPQDIWNKAVFSVDLRFSIWARQYRRRAGTSRASVAAYCYRMAMHERGRKNMYLGAHAVVYAGGQKNALARTRIMGASVKVLLWDLALRACELSRFDFSYWRRWRLLAYIDDVGHHMRKTAGSRGTFSHKYFSRWLPRSLQRASASKLLLQGSLLIKEYQMPFVDDQREIALNEEEIAALRFLYWPRKERDFNRAFKNGVGKGAVEDFLRHHMEIGSIVRERDWLLCVANDPGYWEIEESRCVK